MSIEGPEGVCEMSRHQFIRKHPLSSIYTVKCNRRISVKTTIQNLLRKCDPLGVFLFFLRVDSLFLSLSVFRYTV